jgi:hypothetical protein
MKVTAARAALRAKLAADAEGEAARLEQRSRSGARKEEHKQEILDALAPRLQALQAESLLFERLGNREAFLSAVLRAVERPAPPAPEPTPEATAEAVEAAPRKRKASRK